MERVLPEQTQSVWPDGGDIDHNSVVTQPSCANSACLFSIAPSLDAVSTIIVHPLKSLRLFLQLQTQQVKLFPMSLAHGAR
jgi:hypothetical protein